MFCYVLEWSIQKIISIKNKIFQELEKNLWESVVMFWHGAFKKEELIEYPQTPRPLQELDGTAESSIITKKIK